MLATLIPLFDDKMSVCAYSVFARKENHFLNPGFEGGARYDGAGTIHELEVVSSTFRWKGSICPHQSVFYFL